MTCFLRLLCVVFLVLHTCSTTTVMSKHKDAAGTLVADREIVVFTTGYDGPIDNADDWQFFDFERATTIVSLGGRVPSKLVARAHDASVKVVWGAVLDVDISNTSAVLAWAAAAAESSALVDGVHVVSVRNQRNTAAGSFLPRALAHLRVAIGPTAQLSLTLPVIVPSREHIDRPAVAREVDFVVLRPDQNVSIRFPKATIALDTLSSVLTTTKLPLRKVVVGLPWYGWDFRCSTFVAGECLALPPPRTAATWRGWNVQRSAAYILNFLGARNGSKAMLNKTTMDMTLKYTDRSGVAHVVRSAQRLQIYNNH